MQDRKVRRMVKILDIFARISGDNKIRDRNGLVAQMGSVNG